MNSVFVNQIAGMLRTSVPVIIAVMVVKMGLPEEIAGPLAEALIILFATLIAALMSWLSNRGSAVVKQAASEPGVTIEVRPNADQSIKDVAFDPTEYSVVPIK